LPVVAASYVFTGRFNPESEFEKHPAEEPGPDNAATQPGRDAAALCEERLQIVGTPSEWKNYRSAFDSLAEENRDILRSRELARFFKQLDEAGTASVDSDGTAWMEISENGESFRVGVSESNALAPGSDAQLTYKLFLARAGVFLKSPKHRRETMLEFQGDWANLQHASAALAAISATNSASYKFAQAR